MNISTKQKQAHRHGEQTSGCQRGGEVGVGRIMSGKDYEFGISRCKLLCI